MTRTLYDVLGLAEDAAEQEIKSAWRTAAREHHPDRNPGEKSAEAFKLAKRAYDVLSDPARRARYDAQLVDLRRPRCRGCGESVLAGQALCPLCALMAASDAYEQSDEARSRRCEIDKLNAQYAQKNTAYAARHPAGMSSDALLQALVSQSAIQETEREHGAMWKLAAEMGPKERAAIRALVRRLGSATRWVDDLRRWVEG